MRTPAKWEHHRTQRIKPCQTLREPVQRHRNSFVSRVVTLGLDRKWAEGASGGPRTFWGLFTQGSICKNVLTELGSFSVYATHEGGYSTYVILQLRVRKGGTRQITSHITQK